MRWNRTRTGWLPDRPYVRIRGRLLRDWRVADALEAYTAPLLSRSGVLPVQLLRDQLDLSVGAAVRASGDAGLLVRCLSTDMGAGDFQAVDVFGRRRKRDT